MACAQAPLARVCNRRMTNNDASVLRSDILSSDCMTSSIAHWGCFGLQVSQSRVRPNKPIPRRPVHVQCLKCIALAASQADAAVIAAWPCRPSHRCAASSHNSQFLPTARQRAALTRNRATTRSKAEKDESRGDVSGARSGSTSTERDNSEREAKDRSDRYARLSILRYLRKTYATETAAHIVSLL